MNGTRFRRAAAVLAGLGVLLIGVSSEGLRAQQAGPADSPGPAEAAATDVRVTDTGRKVELHARDAEIRQLLTLLGAPRKINIIPTKEIRGTVTADLYGVTFEEALNAVLTSAGFGYVRKGNFIYVYTQKQLEHIQAAQRRMVVRVFRLNYITASDAKTLIAGTMSKDGTVAMTPKAEVGVAASSEDSGGNAHANEDVIIVRDYPEYVEKVASVLKELDVRPLQVLIEATIMRATLDENNALGIDFNVLDGIDFRTMDSASTGMTTILPGKVPAAELDSTNATFRTDFNAGIDPGGLTIGVTANKLAFFIRALETVTDVAVLANPKILVMNKQRGEVLVGNRDGYLTTTITETTATQTVEFLETGTKLLVRPYIANDGYVRLEIHPADSTGGVSAEQLPYEQTTECTSNVLIKDGHTIVIGGLFRERTSNARAQVPFLGNIPIAGNLFRRRVEETKREEVIILITPHIIKHPADELASERMKDQVERFRVGLRQGLMWWGRERMAQTHLRWARRHLARGERGKALWDVEMSLSLEPRMAETISLKERLTNQAIWAHEARYSSIGYILQQMIMRELGRPVDEVIPPLKPRNGAKLDKKVRDAFGIGAEVKPPVKGSEEARPPSS